MWAGSSLPLKNATTVKAGSRRQALKASTNTQVVIAILLIRLQKRPRTLLPCILSSFGRRRQHVIPSGARAARDARDLHLASEEPPLGARAKNRLLGYDEDRGFLM